MQLIKYIQKYKTHYMFRHRCAITRELSEQRHTRPARLCKYCVAFVKIIKILKLQKAQINNYKITIL
jgi:hypothetical protein